jgi:hypothetical protein
MFLPASSKRSALCSITRLLPMRSQKDGSLSLLCSKGFRFLPFQPAKTNKSSHWTDHVRQAFLHSPSLPGRQNLVKGD